MEEKSRLEARLNEINDVLGTETAANVPSSSLDKITAEYLENELGGVRPQKHSARESTVRRGRRPNAGNTMSMREAVSIALSNGPVARKDLVKAVKDVGYVFTSKNPLNSLGSVLYAKNSRIKNKGGMLSL
jgi:hypothetical protein